MLIFVLTLMLIYPMLFVFYLASSQLATT